MGMAKEEAAEATKEQASVASAEKETPKANGTAPHSHGSTEEAPAAAAAEGVGATDESRPAANGEEGANGASELPEDDPEEAEGILPSPVESFKAAHDIVSKIHGMLDKISACKLEQGEAEHFSEHAREIQHLLLVMRRIHRVMVKASDLGRANEAAARRQMDTALAHLESRQYESGCLRSAARRCRSFPTPELDKLRPKS